jgi:catechol 2,3-dioxygenase-like lactoylglutathione lyase family enzyme
MDPDKNLIDVTTGDFGVSTAKTPFPIRHMALFTADPKRLADFYGATFGLKPVGYTDRGSIFVSEGYFNQALLYQRVREKNGFNHSVSDPRCRRNSRLGRKSRRAPWRRPAAASCSPNSACEPEGNGIDISVKGFMPGSSHSSRMNLRCSFPEARRDEFNRYPRSVIPAVFSGNPGGFSYPNILAVGAFARYVRD